MKKKFVLISIVGLLVVAGGGASAYFLVLKGNQVDAAALAAESGMPAEARPVKQDPALYLNLPALIVSANYQGKLRYLQVKMSVMTRNEKTLEELQANTPLLQDSLILLLGNYEFSELETTEGKEDLRSNAQAKISELVGGDGIESVLFTGFVIQ